MFDIDVYVAERQSFCKKLEIGSTSTPTSVRELEFKSSEFVPIKSRVVEVNSRVTAIKTKRSFCGMNDVGCKRNHSVDDLHNWDQYKSDLVSKLKSIPVAPHSFLNNILRTRGYGADLIKFSSRFVSGFFHTLGLFNSGFPVRSQVRSNYKITDLTC